MNTRVFWEMRIFFSMALVLMSLALCGWADPTDRQVLELHQRWNAAVLGANDFNTLAPFMSKAGIEMPIRSRQAGGNGPSPYCL